MKKCETILFHKPLRLITSSHRAGFREFQVEATVPRTNDRVAIPHKRIVKYLAFYLDDLIRGNAHPDTQLIKARKSFQSYSRIFFNRMLTNRTKIILYTVLIRPIITYAAPVWWNTGNSVFEKIRIFERMDGKN